MRNCITNTTDLSLKHSIIKKIVSALLVILFTYLPCQVVAQLQGGDYEYKVEYLYGFTKGTNGGILSGFFGRRGSMISKNMFRNILLEVANIKHEKETRVTTRTGKTFILGKSNYLYVVRGGYGYENILFRKAAQHGVQVGLLYAGGLSLGVVSPYYVSIQEVSVSRNNLNISRLVEEPYTYELVDNGKIDRIVGYGNSFRGLSDANLVPGLYARVSLGFEFGVFKKQVSGFEFGVLVDAYSSPIEIIANQERKSVYTQVFFSLFYGFRK